jgi:vancomycin resistance protein YoaR
MSVGRKAKTKKSHLKHNAASWIKEWYNAHMPQKRWQRGALWIVFIVLAVVIAGQLAWPSDRGLPLATINGHNMALASHQEMASVLVEEFDKSKLELQVGADKTLEYPLKATGAEPNTEKMIEKLSKYSLWQRLIPGSILWQAAQVNEADVYYSNERLKKFAEENAKKLSFAPKNARLAVENGEIVATEAVAGSKIVSDELLKVISSARIALGKATVVDVPARRTAAVRTAKDLAKVRGEAEAVLAHTVTISAGDQKFSPERKEIASWVVLNTNDKGDVTLVIDREKIKAYLNGINEKVGTPAGQTDITIVDGREVGRSTGVAGKAVDIDALAEKLAAALLVPPPEISVEASLIDIAPSVIYNSRYTATQAGLQAYVNDIAWSRNMFISIRQLDGERWTAQARETESIPSASTYKLYVSLVLFDKINKGEIHWDDPMLDTTVAGCFERMTVASTNPCAESWLAQFGRDYVNSFIYARGFSTGTSFTTGYANQTTAADLTKFMIGLHTGTLLQGANRDRLLDSLGRHPYPYGIPTGSAGVVHNKVGFLWDYVHDAAIVQHPRGTYIMTIMTKGQSYGAIANVTREIERIMYP